jgi:hypothetical protein
VDPSIIQPYFTLFFNIFNIKSLSVGMMIKSERRGGGVVKHKECRLKKEVGKVDFCPRLVVGLDMTS